MRDECWLPSEGAPQALRTPAEIAAWELRAERCELSIEPEWDEDYALERIGEGWRLRGGETGVLYGAYRLLMHLRGGDALPEGRCTPENTLRMLDHWDNMDGSIERGYAGRSLWFEGGVIAYDAERLRQYARLLASVGVNTICLNNVNVVDPAQKLIDDPLLGQVGELAALFAPYGVRLMVSIDYASPTYDGVPTADPLDERVVRWWEQAAERVYRQVPSLRGFLVKADSEHRPGPYTYGRDHAQGANLLARALKPHGGVVVWRCFVYNCKQDWRDTRTDRPMAAMEHYAHLDGRFEENVILQIKNGPVDFQVREPLSPLLLQMPHTSKALEVQLAQEYTGQQIDLYAMSDVWREICEELPRTAVSAVAAVANTGRDAFLTGHPFAQYNLFAFGRMAWSRDRDFEQEARLWARLTYGLAGDALQTLAGLLMRSRAAYQKYTSTLGLGWMVTPHVHYGPSPLGYEYAPWGTYHRADREGVGVDRTANGTGYLLQYPEALRRRYADAADCPDDLLLFFHRLPYNFVMRDGRTLIRRIYDDHAEGVRMAEEMARALATLEKALPRDVWECAQTRMGKQLCNAREWRDVTCDFFFRLSGVPIDTCELYFVGCKCMEVYPNIFSRIGVTEAETDARIAQTVAAIFTDPVQRFFFESGDDAGYFLDTGNIDARTEGMSYGMMMAAQLRRKDLFDRLWTFSKRHMWHARGRYAGYFAWSVKPDGRRNAQGPAPDGEEYYAMALFFASALWGDGEPPYDYGVQARDILRHVVHQAELTAHGDPMWDPATALIRFTPESHFSDASYHLPHFYERFAALCDPADSAFWRRAANASRDYICRSCHPITGLAPEYGLYDGSPETAHGHGDFFSDAYRVAMNIGLDSAWNGKRPAYKAIADRLQAFLWDKEPLMTYALDGTPKQPPALHPVALVATTAAASLATDTPLSLRWVERFWQTPMREGDRRYYDNCLYLFTLWMLSGRYACLA